MSCRVMPDNATFFPTIYLPDHKECEESKSQRNKQRRCFAAAFLWVLLLIDAIGQDLAKVGILFGNPVHEEEWELKKSLKFICH